MMVYKKQMLGVMTGLALSLVASANDASSYSQSGYNGDWSSGWYVGAGVNGDPNTEAQVTNPVEGSTLEKTQGNVGFDIYAGRKVSDYFSYEVGYSWIGDQEFDGIKALPGGAGVQGVMQPQGTEATVEQWNVHAAGLLSFPVGDYFSIFGKAGVAYYQNEMEFTVNPVKGTVVKNGSDELHTFAFLYGAGAQLAWDQFGFRAEYTIIRPNQYDRDTFYISDVISASLFYRFM